MKRFAIIAVVFSALAGAPAFAQQPPGPGGPGDGPPPEVQQHIEQARTNARTQAMTALSGDHQTKVTAALARVKAAQVTDLHDAAQQLYAILSAKEAKAVIAAREKFMTDVHDTVAGPDGSRDGQFSPGRGPGFGPNGGPAPGDRFAPGGGPGPGAGFGPGPGPGAGGDGPPPDGRRRLAGHPTRDDAGLALLMLNLSRDQMHTLFADGGPPR
jgi:hypothetical protein